MSSDLSALLSATFYEPGDAHRIELIHQRDRAAHRRLEYLDLALYDPEGKGLRAEPIDPRQEILDLGAFVGTVADAPPRVMVLLDARYDERIFPYRPHHYGFLHRQGSTAAALYYAANAVLGGVCGNCPSSIMLVVNGIEEELRKHVPEVAYIEAVP